MHGSANGRRPVNSHIQVKRRRDRGAKKRHDGHDAVNRLDHVCAGLAEDGHEDAVLSVGQAEIASVFDRIDYFGDVAQTNGSALMAGDDERLVFVRFEKLVGVGNSPSLFGVGKRAFGKVGVGGLQ